MRNSSLLFISLIIGSAIGKSLLEMTDFVFVNPNWIDAHSQVCFIDIFVRDIIFWLPIFTANDVGFNLFPLHSGHSTFDMYFSISFFE